MSVVRRLLALLMLTGAAAVPVVALAGPAGAACPADRSSLEQHASAADAVFTGSVADRSAEGTTVTYTVDVDTVYKGRVEDAQVTVTTDRRARACGLPDLESGSPYAFFAQRSADTLAIDANGGTHAASDAFVAQVEELLGDGRPAVPPAPVEATFTTVADAPAELRRVAAPGVALVIVGVLGLALVSWRGRRRA